MGTHTPGPWEAVPHELPQWAVRVNGSEFHYIALSSQGNDEANARLIAAAPDLLDACELALSTILALDPHGRRDGATPATVLELRAAIARATQPATEHP